MSQYTVKDSGQRQEFSTGAKRDTQEGKPRYELIPPRVLHREAVVFTRGAEKYGEHNWQKGIPLERIFASLLRHAYAWAEGDDEEDHLAAVRVNAAFLMATEEEIVEGRLPKELATAGPLKYLYEYQERAIRELKKTYQLRNAEQCGLTDWLQDRVGSEIMLIFDDGFGSNVTGTLTNYAPENAVVEVDGCPYNTRHIKQVWYR